jgi:Ca-activated chloride channel homolog
MRVGFALDCEVLFVEQPKRLFLAARLEAGPVPGDGQRTPLNLSLVIDRSGSMQGAKLSYTLQAAQFLVSQLTARDRFSVVTYNGAVDTIVPPQPVKRKDDILQLLAQIVADGTTNLSGGWLAGVAHVNAGLTQGATNRVLLMTDGKANRGITDSAQLIALAGQKHSEDVSTTTLGMGQDFHEDLLVSMAMAGGGSYYYIESPEVAPAIFEKELAGLLQVVGQNLQITLVPSAHIRAVAQLNAYPESRIGPEYAYALGDIYGDEEKVIVLALDVPAIADLGSIEIARLRFAYDAIEETGSTHYEQEIPVMVHVERETVMLPPQNAEVQRTVLLLQAAQARRQAVDLADQGEFDRAREALQEIAKTIAASTLADERLADEYDALMTQATQLSSQRYDQATRKAMFSEAAYSMAGRHEETVSFRARQRGRAGQQPMTDTQEVLATLRGNAAEATIPSERSGQRPTFLRVGGTSYPLDGDIIRIGRSGKNEIQIHGQGISREHCRLFRRGDVWMVEDSGSTNGTRLNGVMLDGPKRLLTGDQIQLSQTVIAAHGDDSNSNQ